MGKTGFAYFVERPRVMENLFAPHFFWQEQAYEIVMTVKLAKIDYENFITDMLADRQFLEDYAALCSQGDVWKCLLIQQQGKRDGILAMPKEKSYLGWAAYYSTQVT